MDIFSLGIIFFEICQPFTTGMERAEVRLARAHKRHSHTQALRDIRSGKFPENFSKKRTKEADVIRWLLKEDPTERPTCVFSDPCRVCHRCVCWLLCVLSAVCCGSVCLP